LTTKELQERTVISMRDAVGYPDINCSHEATIDDALVLKHDRLFLLLDAHGDITPPGQCGLGLFHDDTRILSHYSLRLNGRPAQLLSSQVPRMYGAVIDLALTDRDLGGQPWDPKNSIHLRRELMLDERLVERVTLTNYLTSAVEIPVELAFGCDFADIFEVRGWRRDARGQYYAPEFDRQAVCFSYRGRDGQLVSVVIRFAEQPDDLRAHAARWQVRLPPNARETIEWEVVPGETALVAAQVGKIPPVRRRERLEAEYEAWREQCSRWTPDVAEFALTLDRATDDLRALYVEIEDEDVISAGIPWYSTVFGRDSIITSLQALAVNPRIAVDTLRYLARQQGSKEDEFTEEQPGKILHELRRGEMARAGEIPHVPYYGTVDATPLWLILLHETWRWTGDEAMLRELLPNAERALEWIDRYGDLDGDGFIEYHRTSEKGLANQGWKDSGDGVPYPDGRLPEGPIALVEVQGYVYDAKLRMAATFAALGDHARAAELSRAAERLRRSICEHFWLEELGTFALALDGEKNPLPTETTNAGHLLWSRVPDPEQAARMAQQLLEPAMFSGWGIRTLSARHPVFNPMSYHNGSVWPHDNAIAVLGLRLQGHARKALPVLTGLHEAASNMRFHRLPELFCGMERGVGTRPVLYPVSCSPQAWASGAFFMMLQGVLGILPDAPAGVLHIREPELPPFLRELTVSNLRIGGSRVAVQFRRHEDRTLANPLSITGDALQVRIEFA
jgi:glycogen debranching enzyme